MAAAGDDLLLSVYPRTHFTTPTPEATPRIGTLSSPVESFRESNPFSSLSSNEVLYSRAWSTITRHLALQPGIESAAQLPTSGHERNALLVILASDTGLKDLASWFLNEIRRHFRDFVRRPLLAAWDGPILLADAPSVLHNTIHILQMAQRNRYLPRINGLAAHDGQLKEASDLLCAEIKLGIHAMVLHSLPRDRLHKTLTDAIFRHLTAALELQACQVGPHEMQEVGFGGLIGKRALAHALHRFLRRTAMERDGFQVDWNGHSSIVPNLTAWVENQLSSVIRNTLAALDGDPSLKSTPSIDTQQLVSIAVSNLGRLRTLNLFDYVKTWPSSMGAILDIREHLIAGSLTDKIHVCQSFSNQIQTRLLHAGASTSEILSIYVNVIHVFRTLDSRGVLLDKVALPIRNYLRSREDTVSIIAASFLDDGASSDMDKTCPDIAMEVVNSTLANGRERKLNWDDMEWLPDPIDAGPDYKSSQTEDVIAHILGLFEVEDFIKEVTAVLAQHLLQGHDPEYVKETRLVELFKSRLDASKLQAAEVMLKDMRDSVTLGKRINPHARYDEAIITQTPPTPREIQAAIPAEGITLSSLYQGFESRMKRAQFMAAVKLVATKRNDLFFAKRTRIPANPPAASSSAKNPNDLAFRANVLSSFFWPQLRSDEFDISPTPAVFQTYFEDRFNALGSQRKLHFRPALARASLRLDLEDRTVEEHDVAGWRASVIDAFSTDRLQDSGLRVEQICQILKMDEELAQDALNFWTSKNVLYQPEAGLYAVLERLDMDRGTSAPQDAQPQESISAVVSQDAMLRESAPMFTTFIANMLRNQGPKQIGGMMGITSLLKMVLPTFSYGDDEVAWLLGEMEGKGEIIRNGELWSMAA